MEAARQNIENELKKLYRDEKERIASLAGTYLGDMDNPVSVSYTHLTLPTSASV